MTKPIFVTQPSLPPLEEFLPYLESIWESKILTNGGPLHQQLETALCEYLGVGHISLFNNGTIALLVALKALDIRGEVITTPYSFVATSHALLWNGVTPVFVDTETTTFNLDPAKIESAITARTSAIMPVHCYGRSCDVHAIQKIAEKHGLKIIYDAAHAFGGEDEGGSILRHGDLSVLSFHATKVFNTFEGGAIVCPDAAAKRHVDFLKNFGFANESTVVACGINGKMSELNAALGLLQLKNIDSLIAQNSRLAEQYRKELTDIKGIALPDSPALAKRENNSYFPILIQDGYPITRDELYEELKCHGVHCRRYFYPLISEFPMYKSLPSACEGKLTVAKNFANRVLCLPIYPDLTQDHVHQICVLLKSNSIPK